jgi:predicted enzyme related to lactoylglutathione lyase
MTDSIDPAPSRHPAHGQPTYLQIPALDVEGSACFYQHVFGWTTETTYGSFEAPGLIGQFTTERPPAGGAGPVLWLAVDDMYHTMRRVEANHGTVASRPQLDQGARWLVEIDDPAGNRIGIVAPNRRARPQPMLIVRDVEASSAFYQQLLGLTSDHGGPDYERLLSDGELVLQLHHPDVAHTHGPLGSPDDPVGNGVLVWFGEVADFDGAVARAASLGAPVTLAPHRNPPAGSGNGPAHREAWISDPDGYVVVIASPDGEAWELPAPT